MSRHRLPEVVSALAGQVEVLEGRVEVLERLRPVCRVCLTDPATRVTAIGVMCDKCEFPPPSPALYIP
jgi:hypothetical protein